MNAFENLFHFFISVKLISCHFFLSFFPSLFLSLQGQPLIDWDQPVEVAGEIRTAVPINEFAKHVAELHADGDIGFSKEYEAIQNESINEEYASEHSQHPDNKQKNRYLNIIACKYQSLRAHIRCI